MGPLLIPLPPPQRRVCPTCLHCDEPPLPPTLTRYLVTHRMVWRGLSHEVWRGLGWDLLAVRCRGQVDARGLRSPLSTSPPVCFPSSRTIPCLLSCSSSLSCSGLRKRGCQGKGSKRSEDGKKKKYSEKDDPGEKEKGETHKRPHIDTRCNACVGLLLSYP